jgi:putative hydrolase of the HAD superfamily
VSVRHWLFDLDDTLYPASSGLFRLVSGRITRRIGELLDLPEDEARKLQRAYWRKYGTSLRGLVVEHGVDPEPFLAYVHDVPVEDVLVPDPALVTLLRSLPGERHIFTNGPSEFAHRVLVRLGARDAFDRLFDIRHAEFVPKPDPLPYRRALKSLGVPAGDVALVDDAPQNVARGRELGLWTVWLRSPHSVAGGSAGNSVALGEGADVLLAPHVVIDHLAELPGVLGLRAGARAPHAGGESPPPATTASAPG